MAPEVMEMPVMDRLETKYRNLLQVEVMKQMIGNEPTEKEELDWALTYGKKVSDLIDGYSYDEERNLVVDEIRTLAGAGNYSAAAKLLRELLAE